MKIKICENKGEWEKWQKQKNLPSFLQSWDWGIFQGKMGQKPLRLQILGSQSDQIQGFVHKLGLGVQYGYFPRLESYLPEMKDWLDKQGLAFIRLEPLQEIQSGVPVKNRQPQQTLILDLTKSAEELLQGMHSKTRYNIGLGERKGVTIKQEKNLDVFWQLNQETTERDQFQSHDKEYYKKMLDLDMCHQLTAYVDNKPVVSNLLIIFHNTCTYLHGASSQYHKNLMAPYLLQWQGIKLAKSLGCQYYDFWGIASKTSAGECFNNFCWQEAHDLSGVTRFKAGFGGSYVEYPVACDIILNRWKYGLYKLARKIKGLK